MNMFNSFFKKKIAVLDKDINTYSLYKKILEKRLNCRLYLIDNYDSLNLKEYDLLITDLDLNDDFDILGLLEKSINKIPTITIADDNYNLDIDRISKVTNCFLTKHDCLFHLTPKVAELLSSVKNIDNIDKKVS